MVFSVVKNKLNFNEKILLANIHNQLRPGLDPTTNFETMNPDL